MILTGTHISPVGNVESFQSSTSGNSDLADLGVWSGLGTGGFTYSAGDSHAQSRLSTTALTFSKSSSLLLWSKACTLNGKNYISFDFLEVEN